MWRQKDRSLPVVALVQNGEAPRSLPARTRATRRSSEAASRRRLAGARAFAPRALLLAESRDMAAAASMRSLSALPAFMKKLRSSTR